MGALAAIWGSVISDVKTTGQNIVTAAEQAAAQGVTQIRTDAGTAIQQTGVGAGAAVAPPNSAPAVVATLVEHWPVVLIILLLLFLGRR